MSEIQAIDYYEWIWKKIEKNDNSFPCSCGGTYEAFLEGNEKEPDLYECKKCMTLSASGAAQEVYTRDMYRDDLNDVSEKIRQFCGIEMLVVGNECREEEKGGSDE